MAAVKLWDAERYLASPPVGVRLFLIHGADQGGVTEGARRVEQVALQRGGGDAVLRFGSDILSDAPGRIADEVYSASLFGGEPVVTLRVLDGRHNVLGAVEPILERPPEAAWLIVEAGELARTSPLLKAFETAPQAAVVALNRLEEKTLAAFIRTAAEDAGKILEPAAVDPLIERLGGDRLATRSELEKLFLYVGEGNPVTAAHVAAVVGETAEVRGDGIIDAALVGDSESLDAGLERMRAEGGPAAGLAAQAIRHLIQLESFRASMDGGARASTLIERARPPIFSRRRGAVEAALNRWSSDGISEARRTLAHAVALTRRVSSLEQAAVSNALHEIALQSRRLRRDVGR
jgi:DNA polymerase-3 subunit delta